MPMLLRIFVMRGNILLRRLARLLGLALKKMSKRLIAFGDEEHACSWGAPSLLRIARGELEVVGPFNRVSRGPLYAARFRCAPDSARRVVVLRLNWIATKNPLFNERALNEEPWSFEGKCDIVVDPIHSPLHELDDGTLWFMWPEGGYGVIHLDPKTYLAFGGYPGTPREYSYF